MSEEKEFSTHSLDECLALFVEQRGGAFHCSVLFARTIFDRGGGEGSVLWVMWAFVLKLFEGLCNVIGHRQVDFAIGVVPIQGDANVSSTRPVGANRIMGF